MVKRHNVIDMMAGRALAVYPRQLGLMARQNALRLCRAPLGLMHPNLGSVVAVPVTLGLAHLLKITSPVFTKRDTMRLGILQPMLFGLRNDAQGAALTAGISRSNMTLLARLAREVELEALCLGVAARDHIHPAIVHTQNL